MRSVAVYALLIVASALAGGAAFYGMREIMNGASRRIEVDLRNDFVRHLLRLDAGFHAGTRTGDLMSLATNDTLAVRQAAGPGVMYSANTTMNFVLGTALMLWMSPPLTVVVLLSMAVLPPVVIWFGRVIHRRFERIQAQFGTLSAMVQENLSGVRIVRAYGQETGQAGEFDALNREYLRRNMRLAYVGGAFHPVLGLVMGGAMVVMLWYGGRLVMAGTITAGAVDPGQEAGVRAVRAGQPDLCLVHPVGAGEGERASVPRDHRLSGCARRTRPAPVRPDSK